MGGFLRGGHMGIEMRDLKWSPSEKTVARRAFDLALAREFDWVTQEVKRMAASLKDRSALWELEDFLTKSRKEIDRKYDYRYSVLTMVFGYLIREGRLTEDELRGLGEDKLEAIRRITKD